MCDASVCVVSSFSMEVMQIGLNKTHLPWSRNMLVPCLNDTTNHQTTLPLMQVKAAADTPADSLTQSLADDVTALTRSERHAQNNNKTADWYKAVLMNPRQTA